MTNPKDICYKCPNGTYNRDIIDTAKLDNIQLDVCAPIDCSCGNDGTIIKNDDSCEKGEEKICVCDREHLFYGWDPLACQRMEDQSLISRIKRPGNELTNSALPKETFSRCSGLDLWRSAEVLEGVLQNIRRPEHL